MKKLSAYATPLRGGLSPRPGAHGFFNCHIGPYLMALATDFQGTISVIETFHGRITGSTGKVRLQTQVSEIIA